MMLNKKHTIALAITTVLLSACDSADPTKDFSIDSIPPEEMTPGIWVDGNGCDHWIIDDGIEGYMTPRFDEDGKPMCREGAVPYSTINFRRTITGLSYL